MVGTSRSSSRLREGQAGSGVIIKDCRLLRCFRQIMVACLFFFTGVKLTLSALVDGKSINAGGHKLGLALELEA